MHFGAAQFKQFLKLPARKRLGTRWAKYPFSRCRVYRCLRTARALLIARPLCVCGSKFVDMKGKEVPAPKAKHMMSQSPEIPDSLCVDWPYVHTVHVFSYERP